jgi:hypothetical protein
MFIHILDLLMVEGQQFSAVEEFVIDFEAAVWQGFKSIMPQCIMSSLWYVLFISTS